MPHTYTCTCTHVHRCPAIFQLVPKEPIHPWLQAPNPHSLGPANPCCPSSRMWPPGAFPVMMCVPPALDLGTLHAPHVATLRDWLSVSVDATMTQVTTPSRLPYLSNSLLNNFVLLFSIFFFCMSS